MPQHEYRNVLPKWAGAPSFAGAARAAARWDDEWDDGVRTALAECRVMGFARGQVEALGIGSSSQEVATILKGLHLPFEPLYIDMQGAWGAVGGALFTRHDDGQVEIWPVWKSDDQYSFVGCTRLGAKGQLVHEIPAESEAAESDTLQDSVEDFTRASGVAASLVVAFLEHPRGEMVEGGHISRQQRRAADRKGLPIALTVVIRPSRRKRRATTAGRFKRNFTHRYDRLGHWAHYGRHTKMGSARPDLLRDWPGHPDTRRVWHPPTIVGPAHLPYVPKRFFVELMAS